MKLIQKWHRNESLEDYGTRKRQSDKRFWKGGVRERMRKVKEGERVNWILDECEGAGNRNRVGEI